MFIDTTNLLHFLDLSMKSGITAIVTGGSRGIGAEVVRMFMECDMHVIIGMYPIDINPGNTRVDSF